MNRSKGESKVMGKTRDNNIAGGSYGSLGLGVCKLCHVFTTKTSGVVQQIQGALVVLWTTSTWSTFFLSPSGSVVCCR